MQSSSIYMGAVVATATPLLNQKRYDAVLNEMLQLLQTHKDEVTIELIADRFIVIRSNDPASTEAEQVTFPLSCQFMHTVHFRIYAGSNPSDLVKKFGAITWELLNILKENFPSKVSLVQENIELCAPHYVPMSASEETRRMLSCILSIKEEARGMTIDEVEDVAWTMDYATAVKDYRSLSACLDLLNGDRIDARDFVHCLMPYRDSLLQTVQSEDPRQLQSNKRLASIILQRLDQLEEERHVTQSILDNQQNQRVAAHETLSQASQLKSEPLDTSHFSSQHLEQHPKQNNKLISSSAHNQSFNQSAFTQNQDGDGIENASEQSNLQNSSVLSSASQKLASMQKRLQQRQLEQSTSSRQSKYI